MRLVKISAPPGKGEMVIESAFKAGIAEASFMTAEVYNNDGGRETREIIDVQTSTPKANKFLETVIKADYYSRETFSINVRQPQSLISREPLRKLTIPLVAPATDLCAEHWQFSHVTAGFAIRILIGGGLLAFGMINHQLLIMIAGLLFLPLLPLLLAISFGSITKEFDLAGQGASALIVSIVLLLTAGVAVGLMSQPPVRYDDFNSLSAGALISLAVGLAAVLAGVDDAGRRELIGLAATSQIALAPVWFGVNLVLGFSPSVSREDIYRLAVGFFLNLILIIVASSITYICCGFFGSPLKKS